MADSDIIERLEKQIEGSNLALAAVAEVLQKMDSRLTKAEDDEFEFSQDQEDEMEKQEIIKAVAGEVYGLIKADTPDNMGQWGEGGDYTISAKGSSGSSGTISGSADDSEKAVNVDSKTEHAKRTITAMQKQLALLKDSLENEYGYDVEKAGYGMAKQPPFENGDEDEEDEDEDEKEYPNDEEDEAGMEQMVKAIAGLQKMVSSKSNNVQKMIQTETEQRLRKMGFREENGLNKPRLIRYGDTLGVDDTTPIRKASNPDETVDQMMQMSYAELRRLQEQVESGDHDGVPRELLGY